MILLACGDQKQLSDLKNYVANLKEKVPLAQKKQTTAQYQLPEPAKYGHGSSTVKEEEGSASLGKASTNPLQAYPLKSYQFLGIVTQNQQTWAYLMTPDSMVYQVKEGDVIGDIYGKIIKIDSSHIEVLEKQAGKQQVITLQLKE
jgi:Tfp pilus assembly protein PilP